MKFGGYFFHLNFDPVNAKMLRGTFAFSSTAANWNGQCIGEFSVGRPEPRVGGSAGAGKFVGRTNWGHLYVEDGWQITPSFQLDIGLRYEYNQNVTDANNRYVHCKHPCAGRGDCYRQQRRKVSFRRWRLPLFRRSYRPTFRCSLQTRQVGTTACCRGAHCGWRHASDCHGRCRITRR